MLITMTRHLYIFSKLCISWGKLYRQSWILGVFPQLTKSFRHYTIVHRLMIQLATVLDKHITDSFATSSAKVIPLSSHSLLLLWSYQKEKFSTIYFLRNLLERQDKYYHFYQCYFLHITFRVLFHCTSFYPHKSYWCGWSSSSHFQSTFFGLESERVHPQDSVLE